MAALAFTTVLAPSGSVSRSALALGAVWAAQAFAGGALLVAASRRRGAERLPWALFSLGVASRLVADVVWVGARAFGMAPPAVFQVVVYSLSYVLLFAALLWLMSTLKKEMVSVAWGCFSWGSPRSFR